MTFGVQDLLLPILFFGALAFITLLGALGKPGNWSRGAYLILFFVLVAVDVPVLLLLYLTPTSSSNLSYLDIASDLAVIAFGAAWGCLGAAITFGKLRKRAA